jgi:GNAT superfamily N-acetyltransferase
VLSVKQRIDGQSAARIERRMPTLAEHRRLAEAVGWGSVFDWDRVSLSLERSPFGVVALAGDLVIGMGRLVGDGVMYFYVQDVVVLPEFQGGGVGHAIVDALLTFVRETAHTGAFTGLFATPDAMRLYEQHGFTTGDLNGMFQVVQPTQGRVQREGP